MLYNICYWIIFNKMANFIKKRGAKRPRILVYYILVQFYLITVGPQKLGTGIVSVVHWIHTDRQANYIYY